jgi:hypothetical protein
MANLARSARDQKIPYVRERFARDSERALLQNTEHRGDAASPGMVLFWAGKSLIRKCL